MMLRPRPSPAKLTRMRDVEKQHVTYIPLEQQQAITRQDPDNATGNNRAAKTQVQSATVQVATARAQIAAASVPVQFGESRS
jgi:hypothetical protein